MPEVPLSPMAYVCVVSDYNLPELESCLARRPSDILLVVSDRERLPQAAQRLKQRLEVLLPTVQVHMLDKNATGRPLGGDDVIESQQWVRDVLVPHLQQADLADKPHCLNFTGGTKAMTAALLSGHAWQVLDYKSQGQTELQVLRPENHDGSQVTAFGALPRLPLAAVGPLDVAALHADDVQTDPPNSLIEAQPGASLALARQIWSAQQDNDEALQQLFKALEKLWVHGRNTPEYQVDTLKLAWDMFLPDAQAAAPAALLSWLSHFQTLAPEALQWDEHTITLPGNKPRKQCKQLRDWISGDWLEQLAYHWLLEDGLPEAAVARNIKSGDIKGQSSSQREADLLVHYRGITRLVEIKAGLPPGHAPSELENQVSSLGSRFGKTSKALLIAPQLQQQLTGRRWADFQLRCATNDIELCSSQAELLKFIRGKQP